MIEMIFTFARGNKDKVGINKTIVGAYRKRRVIVLVAN
jgi:hypothetical protein